MRIRISIIYTLVFFIGLKVNAEISGNNFGASVGDVSLIIKPNIVDPKIIPMVEYKGFLPLYLDIYVPISAQASGQTFNPEQMNRIKQEFINAQEILRFCKIQIKVNNIFLYDSDTKFKDYESVEFNGGKISNWERAFFSLISKTIPVVLYVDSLDMTIEDDGTIAVAYPEFYIKKSDFLTGEAEQFYRNKMMGSTVLGNYRGPWTLAHELGHALFNLKHDESNPNNIMFPLGFARSKNPSFSVEQCKQATQYIKENPQQSLRKNFMYNIKSNAKNNI